jgi:hypothetical protein
MNEKELSLNTGTYIVWKYFLHFLNMSNFSTMSTNVLIRICSDDYSVRTS